MLTEFLRRKKSTARVLFIALLIVTQAYLGLLINGWYGVFYNALQNLDQDLFLQSLISLGELTYNPDTWGFSILAALSVLLYAYIDLISSKLQFEWREALTKDLTYKATLHGSIKVEGISQRITDDSRKLAWICTDLFKNGVKSISTLVFFLPVLWTLSSGFEIPGWLVYVALTSSVVGLGISVFVGRKLKRLEYNNQVIEAELRKEVTLGEDAPMQYASSVSILSRLKASYFRLYTNYKWYALWENSYFQVSVIIPFMASAPQFFAGAMTLGVLMQVSNAFQKCHRAFSYFIQNWARITNLLAVLQRMREAHAVYDGLDNKA